MARAIWSEGAISLILVNARPVKSCNLICANHFGTKRKRAIDFAQPLRVRRATALSGTVSTCSMRPRVSGSANAARRNTP
jgi:hypothetical protein